MKRYRVILKSGQSFTVHAKGILWDGERGQFCGTKEGNLLKFGFVEPVEEFVYLEEQVAAVHADESEKSGPEVGFLIHLKKGTMEGTNYVSGITWVEALTRAQKKASENEAELVAIERIKEPKAKSK